MTAATRATATTGDDDVVPGTAQPREEPVHRRSVGGSVVDDGERQAGQVVRLADDHDLVARLGEEAPAALGQCLPAEPREGLRRAEPARGAADEQHPRQPRHVVIRSCSV